jgi:predicted transposase/invertase (TIGR01784 family)
LDQFGFDLQRWMQFWAFGSKIKESEMSEILQDCPPVFEANEEFQRFLSNPEMREKVRARERFLNDERLKLIGARREGRVEGRVEGRAEGRAEGHAEGRVEVARNMKHEGFDTATIAKATGLPLSEVERLG